MDPESLDLFGQMISANVAHSAAITNSLIDRLTERAEFGERVVVYLENFAYRQDSKRLERQLLELIERARCPE